MPHGNHVGCVGRLKWSNGSMCVVCAHSAQCLQTALGEDPQPGTRRPTMDHQAIVP
jgi:hypothetical protein